MSTATIAFIGLALRKPRTHRIFHYITAAITMVAAVAYFSMASNLGWTPIDVEFPRANPRVRGANREIFYVRYIDWYVALARPLTRRRAHDRAGSSPRRFCFLTCSSLLACPGRPSSGSFSSTGS